MEITACAKKKQKMEGQVKKHRAHLKNKKLRSRFRECIGNPLMNQVPYDIWKAILLFCHLKTVGKLAQLCKTFREFVEEYRRGTFGVALEYRRENQIRLAGKYLYIHATKNQNPEAIFHLAMAYTYSGWGFQKNASARKKLFLKLTNMKYPPGMIHYAEILLCKQKGIQASEIALEALGMTTCKDYERGLCYFHGLGVPRDLNVAIGFLENASENDNNEFAQEMLASYYWRSKKLDKAEYFAEKAAQSGFMMAQWLLAYRFERNAASLISKARYKLQYKE